MRVKRFQAVLKDIEPKRAVIERLLSVAIDQSHSNCSEKEPFGVRRLAQAMGYLLQLAVAGNAEI